MGIWADQLAKARQRSTGLDLRTLAAQARDKSPANLCPPEVLAARRQFLRQSLGDTALSQKLYERIISGNELQDINYLARGTRASHAVARIVMRGADGRLNGYATGFLITPQVLITNHHVLPDATSAQHALAQFSFEVDIDGHPLTPVDFCLEPQRLFHTSTTLDFSIVAVAATPDTGNTPLTAYGCLPLLDVTGKASEGEWLTIIQHPGGERKQICVRENKLLRRAEDVLWYSTDTLGGSSGSPVFNNDWYVVALHHCGVPEEQDGHIMTLDGHAYDATRDTEEDIRWIANEGIRASRIVATLNHALPTHPLLQTLFSATPQDARVAMPPAQQSANTVPLTHIPSPSQESPMSATAPRTLTVTLEIDSDGQARVINTAHAAESASVGSAEKHTTLHQRYDVPFDSNYAGREGFAEDFLDDDVRVLLPRLSPALEAVATHLLAPDDDQYVLKYHHYSVVMHRERRFALYSAANVDCGHRYRELSGRNDNWREDPRIPLNSQVSAFYYAHNKFDRGHLTRREDLEYGGTRQAALQSANDTCHWTNCTPQQSRFNQGKQLWQGLENYLLDDLRREEFKANVVTGPLLSEDDPVWERFKEIQYPVRFWKVVSALNTDGELFATAYLLDQSACITQYGIEEATAPFGTYKTYQTSIAEIERLTQLSFYAQIDGHETPLSDFDPLKTGIPRSRNALRGVAAAEAFRPDDTPHDYVVLNNEDDIITTV